MTDKEKIVNYLNYKGISKNKFYKKTGFSVGFLDSGSSLGVDKLKIIIDNYHDLNPFYILSDGPMILEDHQLVNEPSATYSNKEDIYKSMFENKEKELRSCYEEIGKLKAKIERLAKDHPNPKYVLGEDY